MGYFYYYSFQLGLILLNIIIATYLQIPPYFPSKLKSSNIIFNAMPDEIGTVYVQYMLLGYCFGYPGLFSVLLITEPHSVEAKERIADKDSISAQQNLTGILK